MDKVCKQISIEEFEKGISCTGEKPPCISVLLVRPCSPCMQAKQIMAHWIGDLQVMPCQSNLMLLSLIDPNFD